MESEPPRIFRSLEATLGARVRLTGFERLVGPMEWSTKKIFGFHRHRDPAQPKAERPKRFTWDVWLWLGSHGLNLSCYGVAPPQPSLDDARGWAIDFAEAHGFKAIERQRARRRPRPKLSVISGGLDATSPTPLPSPLVNPET